MPRPVEDRSDVGRAAQFGPVPLSALSRFPLPLSASEKNGCLWESVLSRECPRDPFLEVPCDLGADVLPVTPQHAIDPPPRQRVKGVELFRSHPALILLPRDWRASRPRRRARRGRCPPPGATRG